MRPSFGRAGTLTGTPMPFAMALPPVAAGAYVRVRKDTSAGAKIADFRTIRPPGFELEDMVELTDRVEFAELETLAGFQPLASGGGLDVGIDIVIQA